MALLAIGDVQGCSEDLYKLLEIMQFNPDNDELWLTGDLVNRGPDSAGVLRFVKELPKFVSVLGNHDLHLLAVAYTGARHHEDDTLEDILDAPDREELLHWLRYRPMMHVSDNGLLSLVHAGISPQWSMTDALYHASEVEQQLRSDDFIEFLHLMYGNRPARWSTDLDGMARLRYITNCFTRMRYIQPNMDLNFSCKGPLGTQCEGDRPWFDYLTPEHSCRIVFGHWSALGYYSNPHVIGLDSGCLWGHSLSGVKLDDQGEILEYFNVPCKQYDTY